jgi:hypothetical protein
MAMLNIQMVYFLFSLKKTAVLNGDFRPTNTDNKHEQ